MNPETWALVNTLLILLLALLQFLLHNRSQTDPVKTLEARLAEVEAQLAALQQLLPPK